MLAYSLSDKDLQDEITTKLRAALNKVFAQAYEEENQWFIVSKNADITENAHLNLHLLNTFLAVKSNNVSDLDMLPNHLAKFRNYFLYKAQGGMTLSQFDLAVRGLRVVDHIPFVITNGQGVVRLGDSKPTLQFNFVDFRGKPMTGIKNVKGSLVS